ncbi:hypothetical protein BOX15_Mlig012925g5, partial [Macrostomum lignano]
SFAAMTCQSRLTPLLLLLLLACLAANSQAQIPTQCRSDAYPPPADSEIDWVDVDLDEAPLTRWRNVVAHRGPQLRALIAQFRIFVRNMTGSELLINLVDKDLTPLAHTLPQPFRDEIVGIANMTGIPLGEVTLYNIFYEIFTVCTSIVAEDQKGVLYHARNLDFGLFLGWDLANSTWLITEYLRPAIVNIRFKKSGQTVFMSTNFAGYVGILTALKPGRFSLTMNERFNADGGYIGVIEWILGKRDAVWMGFLTRSVMETADSYAQAKQMLTGTKMLAPAYFILGGNSTMQGCIITRSRDAAIDVWERSAAANHTWYLLQTNYDHWKPPFVLDDRRTPGNKCMMAKGQASMGFKEIFNVLSSIPVLNKLTTYTALMRVDTGEYHSYRQTCKDPCAPW